MNIISLNTLKSISYLKKAKFVEKIGGGANLNALLCHFPNSSVDIEPFAVNFFWGNKYNGRKTTEFEFGGFVDFWPILADF